MDDIEDEFFANLSQATIDTAIEVCFLVLSVWKFLCSGRREEIKLKWLLQHHQLQQQQQQQQRMF